MTKSILSQHFASPLASIDGKLGRRFPLTALALQLTMAGLSPHPAFADENRSPASVHAVDGKASAGPPTLAPTRDTHEIPPIEQSPAPGEPDPRLSGNWGGLRPLLSDRGLDFALIYKGEWMGDLAGGLRRGSTYLGLADLRLSLDGGKLVGLAGSSVFIDVIGHHGGRPSDWVGDNQWTSNLQAYQPGTHLYEAWVQQLFFENKVSVLAGIHDLNTEFYTTDSSGIFLHSNFGIGSELAQTGVNGPSIFPYTAPALRIRTEPTADFYLQTAVFNAHAGNVEERTGSHFRLHANDGQLFIAEAAFRRGRADPSQRTAKYGLGAWTYTRTFDHLYATSVQSTNQGAYFLGEQELARDLSVFLRYGIASSHVSQYKNCMTFGATFRHAGIGYSRAANGDEYLVAQSQAASPRTDQESVIEATYRAELWPGLALQPDFQYIIDPASDPSLANAVVVAVRFELNF